MPKKRRGRPPSIIKIFRPLVRFLNGKPHYWARGFGLRLSPEAWGKVEFERRLYLETLRAPRGKDGTAAQVAAGIRHLRQTAADASRRMGTPGVHQQARFNISTIRYAVETAVVLAAIEPTAIGPAVGLQPVPPGGVRPQRCDDPWGMENLLRSASLQKKPRKRRGAGLRSSRAPGGTVAWGRDWLVRVDRRVEEELARLDEVTDSPPLPAEEARDRQVAVSAQVKILLDLADQRHLADQFTQWAQQATVDIRAMRRRAKDPAGFVPPSLTQADRQALRFGNQAAAVRIALGQVQGFFQAHYDAGVPLVVCDYCRNRVFIRHQPEANRKDCDECQKIPPVTRWRERRRRMTREELAVGLQGLFGKGRQQLGANNGLGKGESANVREFLEWRRRQEERAARLGA